MWDLLKGCSVYYHAYVIGAQKKGHVCTPYCYLMAIVKGVCDKGECKNYVKFPPCWHAESRNANIVAISPDCSPGELIWKEVAPPHKERPQNKPCTSEYCKSTCTSDTLQYLSTVQYSTVFYQVFVFYHYYVKYLTYCNALLMNFYLCHQDFLDNAHFCVINIHWHLRIT